VIVVPKANRVDCLFVAWTLQAKGRPGEPSAQADSPRAGQLGPSGLPQLGTSQSVLSSPLTMWEDAFRCSEENQEQSTLFHRVLEEDQSIMACRTSGEAQGSAGGGGTETQRVEAGTQSEVPSRADQSTVTRIHLADLDYLEKVRLPGGGPGNRQHAHTFTLDCFLELDELERQLKRFAPNTGRIPSECSSTVQLFQ